MFSLVASSKQECGFKAKLGFFLAMPQGTELQTAQRDI